MRQPDAPPLGTATRSKTHRLFAAISCYRPRAFTIVALVVIAALIVLANLSFDEDSKDHFDDKSYGWPLIWHRYVFWNTGWEKFTIGWYWSASRLAANSAIWLAILAGAATACEWLLRRRRLLWSLRTMLAAVALAAASCAWFAAARDRANLQDSLIADQRAASGLSVKRYGPRWLDLLGADRYRRCIVSANVDHRADDAQREKLIARLAKLPQLRRLVIHVDHLTPGMAAALNEMRNLRSLQIVRTWDGRDDDEWLPQDRLPPLGNMTQLRELAVRDMTIGEESLAGLANLRSLSLARSFLPDDEQIWHDCLKVIGNTPQLEHLGLSDMKINSQSLTGLAGLTNLKSLGLDVSATGPSLLSHLPPLPKLESLGLMDTQRLWLGRDEQECEDIGGEVLRRLASLPRLKLLKLQRTTVTAAGLAKLAGLESLEELAIDDDRTSPTESCVSAAGLESLVDLKRLKTLHLCRTITYGKSRYAHASLANGEEVAVLAEDFDRFLAALEALRRAKPSIVIDGDGSVFYRNSHAEVVIESRLDARPVRDASWLPKSGAPPTPPAVKAFFRKAAVWARFDAAGWTDVDKGAIAVSF